jgi:hypothetical protein
VTPTIRWLRRLAWGFLLTLIVAYSLRPADLLPLTPFSEDGFYVLSIARNMAAGLGITYDGILPTNGVQPLIAFLFVPLYWTFPDDPVAALRAATLLQLLIFCGSAVLSGQVASLVISKQRPDLSAKAEVWGFALWAFSFPLFRHSVNGLETGLYLLGLLFFATRLLKASTARSLTQMVELGALLGLLVLIRIDSVYLVASFCAYLTLFDSEEPRISRRLLNATVIGSLAVLVSSPWWIRNFTVFNSFMPTSGTAQMFGLDIAENIPRTLSALAQPLFPLLAPFSIRMNPVFGVVWLSLILCFWSFVIRKADLLRVCRPFLPFVFFWGALTTFYTAFFAAPHFNERYLIPLAVPLIPVLGAAVGTLSFRPMIVRALILLIGGGVFVTQYLTWSAHQRLSGNPMYTVQYKLLAANLPGEARIGAFQSGTLGYFKPNTVNLDGKVNQGALEARRKGELWKYILDQKIDFVVDWPVYTAYVLGPLVTMGCFSLVQSQESFEVWKRQDCPTRR